MSIVVSCWASMSDDGCSDVRDVNWNEHSLCMCEKCGYGGIVKDFELGRQVPSLKTAYVSTAHISEEDKDILDENSWKDSNTQVDTIIKHSAGWIIWVNGARDVFEELEMSEDFMALIGVVEMHGFDLLFLSASGPEINGLKQFSW